MVTSPELIKEKMTAAGYTCKSVDGHRAYKGAPFATGQVGHDCFYLTGGRTSACDGNAYRTHRALCNCIGKDYGSLLLW